jgi:hypothetical protein
MSAPSAAASPNVQLHRDQIRPSVILCCGEDKGAFLDALATLGFPAETAVSEFRSYSVWTLPSVTLILSPIGTGPLEPLLYELIATERAERIILVGTAGCLGAKRLPLGVAYPISEARLAGTGLDRELSGQTLLPDWPDFPAGPSATIVSSDFYYGFSPALAPGDYRHRLPGLRADFLRLSASVDLVDMEVGQFYALCRLIPTRPGLRFLAFKGASNAVDNHGEQNTNAPAVLRNSLRQALSALGIDRF